jgi:hypothetical protein
MNFSIAHQQSQWREELKAIFATFRAAKLSREGRDVAVAALETLLANVQSLPPACMDTELELGQYSPYYSHIQFVYEIFFRYCWQVLTLSPVFLKN